MSYVVDQTPVDISDVKRVSHQSEATTVAEALSTQDTSAPEDASLLDPEDLLILGFNLSSQESMDTVIQHFQQFGEIASFSPLDGVIGACILIGFSEPAAAQAAASAEAFFVEGRQAVIMQHSDFQNNQLSADNPHEVTISGFDLASNEDTFARLKAQVEAHGTIVSWKVINLICGATIVRLAMESVDGIASMFKEPFMFDDVQLFLISEDHLALAPQAHIVVFGGSPNPSEEELHKLKEYFEMFGEISQMFVRNEPEGLMLLISYMSEEAMYKLGACEKHAPLGDELMIQCVKSEVFDKLCSDEFQFDMENAQDRIVVVKGMPKEGEDLSQEVFEGLCDGFKAHIETLCEDINVVKIDMEPSYNITIVEFFEAAEAQKVAAIKDIEFEGRQLTAQIFMDFVAENVVPEQRKEGEAAPPAQVGLDVANQQID